MTASLFSVFISLFLYLPLFLSDSFFLFLFFFLPPFQTLLFLLMTFKLNNIVSISLDIIAQQRLIFGFALIAQNVKEVKFIDAQSPSLAFIPEAECMN